MLRERAECDVPHCVGVALVRDDVARCVRVPQADGGVVAAGEQKALVARQTQPEHRAAVCQQASSAHTGGGGVGLVACTARAQRALHSRRVALVRVLHSVCLAAAGVQIPQADGRVGEAAHSQTPVRRQQRGRQPASRTHTHTHTHTHAHTNRQRSTAQSGREESSAAKQAIDVTLAVAACGVRDEAVRSVRVSACVRLRATWSWR